MNEQEVLEVLENYNGVYHHPDQVPRTDFIVDVLRHNEPDGKYIVFSIKNNILEVWLRGRLWISPDDMTLIEMMEYARATLAYPEIADQDFLYVVRKL